MSITFQQLQCGFLLSAFSKKENHSQYNTPDYSLIKYKYFNINVIYIVMGCFFLTTFKAFSLTKKKKNPLCNTKIFADRCTMISELDYFFYTDNSNIQFDLIGAYQVTHGIWL